MDFSVLVPVWNPAPEHLKDAVRSVVDQTFGAWELLLVADGPQQDAIESLLQTFAESESRIRLLRTPQNVGISGASQVGLEEARGEFVALLDHDDLYSVHALGAFAAEIGRFDDVDLAYSDEDKLDAETEERKTPFFKPAFSMERLRCQMYMAHLLVLRRQLALDVGGFRSDYDGAQDHDLALRVAERARRVLHLPRLLYHWRESPASTAMNQDSKSWAWEAGRKAVQDHLDRTGFPAKARCSPLARGIVDLEPAIEDWPKVSVVIPTGFAKRRIAGVETVLVDNAVDSLIERSTYPNLEVVVVADSESDANSRDELRVRMQSIDGQVVHDRSEFNFARACNLGAIRGSGDVFIFLNDDTEICQPDWIEKLVLYATRPELGAVGAKLLYGDGRVQHGGVWSRGTGPNHRYMGFAGDHPGNFGALFTAQNCVAVTAACLAVERNKFTEVGGFSTLFPLAFNDVDFCFKLLHRGYRNIVDCTTTVVHHESSSRDPAVRDWELHRLEDRWVSILRRDPYDNPNNLAVGVDEYPSSPIDVVERKIHDDKVIDAAARSWPSDTSYLLGVRKPSGPPVLI